MAHKKGQVEEEKLEESKFQQIKEILQCIICVEELKETKATIDCGHAFCLECIQKWSTIENTCPYCKREFTKITEKLIGTSGKSRLNGKPLGLYKRRPKMQLGEGFGAYKRKETKQIQGKKSKDSIDSKNEAVI